MEKTGIREEVKDKQEEDSRGDHRPCSTRLDVNPGTTHGKPYSTYVSIMGNNEDVRYTLIYYLLHNA